MAAYNEVYTITFGDCAENHVGMQMIGHRSEIGFTIPEMLDMKVRLENEGVICQWVDLDPSPYDGEHAAVLIIREGVDYFTGVHADLVLAEQQNIQYDTQYWDDRFKSIKNKQARYNVCFGEEAQQMDLNNKKGTIVPYDSVPYLNMIRQRLPEYLGEKARDLNGEGNRYYNVAKCGIGYHGDVERKKVVAIRLGATMDLHFSWSYKHKCYGYDTRIILQHGDMYVMSEKATGYDWKRSSIPTLRHAAGSKKYTSLDKYIE